ncbi:MAG: DNA-directed RNA polymerase subunit A' [Thermoplasmata archaeon]
MVITVGISKKIKNIKFALLSPDEIRKISVTKIITDDTYDDDGYPINMGLMDPRLGVLDPSLRCKTCGGRAEECPGHFGHIELAMPIIHIGYVKEIKEILQRICIKCGHVFEEGDVSSVCPECKTERKKIMLDKPTTFRFDNEKKTPKEIRECLSRIKDEDLPKLGYKPGSMRPEWMILTVLPVPPINIRPSITLESGDRSEDDLTHKLVDVLRINQRLRENRDLGAPQLIVEDLWELLQYHITTYFDNQTTGIPPARHRSGRPLKTLIQRLKGKEGRFRSNLSGKRVNFSARTVISPDPFISINEVGVPEEMARILTVPLYVNQYNIEFAKELVRHGSSPKSEDGKYIPGVNYVTRVDGKRVKVTDQLAATIAEKHIEIGAIVERHLMDGDLVLFNRQPSLHRISIMCHRVRIMPGKTFRLNLAVCPPYNADFDGDEMNLHVLQSEEARAEGKIIMSVEENILSPRFGMPIIGAIHDHITSLFLLTYKNPKLRGDEVAFIYSRSNLPMPPPSGKDEKGSFWYGRDLFSSILPPDLNMEFRSKICIKCNPCVKEKCEYESWVKIRDGKLLMGTIDSKAIGSINGVLVDKIIRKYGNERARRFLDDLSHLAVAYITIKGFTTGIYDEDIPEDAKKEIEDKVKIAYNEVNKLISEYMEGKLQELPGRSLRETLEVRIMNVLGKSRDESGNIASRYLGMDNPAVMMAKSGARGNMLNLSQMAGSIGQQAVRGERLNRGYFERTLPHFKRGDLGADAHGYVKSSYKKGLSPTEFFFHSMGGREGLVDTAVRTSRSGYMQRRLIHALEDLKVDDDGTVKDTSGTIIQFNYGEDGIDPAKANQGTSVDLPSIFLDVLGHDSNIIDKLEARDSSGVQKEYGEQEIDVMERPYEEEEEEESEGEEENEYEDLGNDYGGD